MGLKRGVVLALLALMIWVPAQAHVVVSPTSLKLTQRPGETGEALLTLNNESDQRQVLTVEPEYWYQGRCRSAVGDWLKAEPKTLTLAARGRATLRLTVRTPDGLDGECLAMVYLAQTDKGGLIAFKKRIGVPLYIRAADTDRVKAEIIGFRAVPLAEGAQHPEVVLIMYNTGNVHLVPFGLVTLIAPGSGAVTTQDFQYREPVFAGQSRELRIPLEGYTLNTGPRQATVQVYLANLYEGQERTLQDQPLTRTCTLP